MTKPDTLSVTFELFTEGVRTNVEKFSISTDQYYVGSPEFLTNLNLIAQHTTDEIENPTPKTEMSNG